MIQRNTSLQMHSHPQTQLHMMPTRLSASTTSQGGLNVVSFYIASAITAATTLPAWTATEGSLTS